MKYLISILFFVSVMLLPACSDFLDKKPDDMLTLEMVFNDKTRTEDWLAVFIRHTRSILARYVTARRWTFRG